MPYKESIGHYLEGIKAIESVTRPREVVSVLYYYQLVATEMDVIVFWVTHGSESLVHVATVTSLLQAQNDSQTKVVSFPDPE